jgi:membrane-associated phospholipid phosphatase
VRVGPLAIVFVLASSTGVAFAQESPWHVSYPREGAIIGAFGAGSLLLSTVQVDTSTRWDHELLPWDASVRGHYSDSASARSDTIAALTVAAPVFAVMGSGVDESAAHRGMIYVESLSLAMFLNATAKYLVQRPRPYVYSTDPAVVRMVEGQEKDSHLSFFSGHSTLVFTAAVAGSYLYGAQRSDEASRAAFWGVELAMASATASLRVRAGKHFYSDVILGALVGAGVGATVPRLYLDSSDRYGPSATEVGAMAGGIVVGTAAAWLMPVTEDVRVETGGMGVMPLPLPGGAGLAVGGVF